MKQLFTFLRGYKKECVLAPFFKLLEATFELFIPLVIAYLIDTAIPLNLKKPITVAFGILVLLGLIGLVCAVVAQYFSAKAAVGFAAKIKQALFSHIQGLSFSQLDKLGASTLITRMTGDINQIQSGTNLTLRLFLRSPIIVFGAAVMAFFIDIRSGYIFLCVIPVLAAVVFGIMLLTVPRHKTSQKYLDEVTKSTRENLSGARTVRAFSREKAAVDEFKTKSELLNRAQKRVGNLSALLNPLTYVFLNIAIILLVHNGAIRVNNGTLTAGQVVALYNYMSQILVELVKMANVILNITKAVACGNRISAVLNLKNNEKDGDITPEKLLSVEFQNVFLSYNETAEPSLEDISFKAESGQTIGIIGSTGSGKTSLVNLIPRFYTATDGSVLINGIDITAYNKNALRKKIAVVPQKAVLFKGSVRDNLCFGEKYADEALLNAVNTAVADDVLKALPNGLDSNIEQGGKNLSGGQRQRLTIARALVRDADILILDDSASALDFATEAALRKSLNSLKQKPITFIVSQRTSSIRYADTIIVLEDGKMVGKGNHDYLLESCEVYKEIYLSSFKDEEGSL